MLNNNTKSSQPGRDAMKHPKIPELPRVLRAGKRLPVFSRMTRLREGTGGQDGEEERAEKEREESEKEEENGERQGKGEREGDEKELAEKETGRVRGRRRRRGRERER